MWWIQMFNLVYVIQIYITFSYPTLYQQWFCKEKYILLQKGRKFVKSPIILKFGQMELVSPYEQLNKRRKTLNLKLQCLAAKPNFGKASGIKSGVKFWVRALRQCVVMFSSVLATRATMTAPNCIVIYFSLRQHRWFGERRHAALATANLS